MYKYDLILMILLGNDLEAQDLKGAPLIYIFFLFSQAKTTGIASFTPQDIFWQNNLWLNPFNYPAGSFFY